MTNQEAIEYIKNEICDSCGGADYGEYYDPNDCKNCGVSYGIQALEKQVPKKPISQKYSVTRVSSSGFIAEHTEIVYTCPVCGKVIRKKFDCNKCHQVIDWSEE